MANYTYIKNAKIKTNHSIDKNLIRYISEELIGMSKSVPPHMTDDITIQTSPYGSLSTTFNNIADFEENALPSETYDDVLISILIGTELIYITISKPIKTKKPSIYIECRIMSSDRVSAEELSNKIVSIIEDAVKYINIEQQSFDEPMKAVIKWLHDDEKRQNENVKSQKRYNRQTIVISIISIIVGAAVALLCVYLGYKLQNQRANNTPSVIPSSQQITNNSAITIIMGIKQSLFITPPPSP